MAKRAETEETLDRIGEDIREHYMLSRNLHLRILSESNMLDEPAKAPAKWDGGQDARGVNHKPVWPKLAAIAIGQHIEPRAWIATLFSMSYMFPHLPRPSDLTNPQVLAKTKSYNERMQAEAFYTLRTERFNSLQEQWIRSKTSGLTAETVARTVAVDPTLAISPIIRFLVVHEAGQFDIAKVLEPSALVQYMSTRRACEEAFGAIIPERLKLLSKAIESEAGSGGPVQRR